MKAVVAGAAGGIGQPLSLLLKTSKYVSELALYDIPNAPVKGVAVDLSHISSPTLKCEGFTPENDGQKLAFSGADIVVIPAGIPRMPGMTRDDLFNKNASIVKGLIEAVAQYCPKAFVLIISNPVNSTVPIAAEVLKKAGVFDPKRLFGVTTLDVVRAETFIQSFTGEKDPSKTVIPVVGGHSGATIVPLFSLAKPSFKLPEGADYDALINRVQFGGDEVVKAKTVGEKSFGSATLSMAFAGYRMAQSVMAAASGEKGVVECTFVYLPGLPGGEAIAKEVANDFFSLPVTLGTGGAESVDNILSKASPQEQKLLEAAKKDLAGNVSKGVSFVLNPPNL